MGKRTDWQELSSQMVEMRSMLRSQKVPDVLLALSYQSYQKHANTQAKCSYQILEAKCSDMFRPKKRCSFN